MVKYRCKEILVEVRDRAFVLTGAGSGIGRATAVALARQGARLALVGRRHEPLEVTADLVVLAGGKPLVVAADITNPTSHRTILDKTLSLFGSIDGLINNAGNVRAGRLESISDEDIYAQVDLNLVAPILLTRAALSDLKRSGDAVIVNVSSGVALVGVPFYSVYAAVKSGLAAFGESLHRELLGEGVHVLTVYPGATDTPMMDSNRAGADLGFRRESAEDVADAIVAGIRSRERTVIRGGDARLALIEANRDRPAEVDERFASMKPDFEAAVSGHRSI
jgi:uncharacterized oxidoreductase